MKIGIEKMVEDNFSNPPKSITFGPRSGFCCFCAAPLGSYHNKFLNLKTGVMSCTSHDSLETSLRKLGFVDYSDG